MRPSFEITFNYLINAINLGMGMQPAKGQGAPDAYLLRDLATLDEIQIKQRWPGCLEGESDLWFNDSRFWRWFLSCFSPGLLGVWKQVRPHGRSRRSSLLHARKVGLLHEVFLRQHSRTNGPRRGFAKSTGGWIRKLCQLLENHVILQVLRLERPVRCLDCCCDFCYPNWTQVCQPWWTFEQEKSLETFDSSWCMSIAGTCTLERSPRGLGSARTRGLRYD